VTDKEKLTKAVKLADAMYYAAQYLTTDASRLHKAMEEYHQFIIHEYFKEEPVSEDLEEAAKEHAVERYRATRDMVLAEKCKWSFKAGAEWNFERIKEALLSEVLPCFMNGGEADEVVAKLEEVLNKK
jgi:hypothetical protein